ncbi:MAG: Ig-like domain-containing protein [Bacteroidales bacterium]|nr:Ig-like domain-containing protein [Bacteroidales bacterium]
MKEKIITLLFIISLAGCCILSKSCANTTSPPSGGPKDTIPPVLIKLLPENNQLNFPTVDGKISLTYNEYTVVKKQDAIYLSPPTKRRPTAKIKGKDIIITFKDTLKENTTYTLDFGDALADNNEGNLAPRLVYTFSTGDSIDSMYVTGTIYDSQTLKPVKGVLVTLYDDLSDSACMLSLPAAANITDDWGFFSIRNVKRQPYRVIAFTDEDKNNMYLQGGESIAFLDSIFEPHKVVNDSIYEFKGFDMKDTLACQKRESELSLYLFKEFMSKQFIKNKGRHDRRMGYLKFSAPNAVINSFSIMGIDTADMLLQYTPTMDSLTFWITSSQRLEDSLLVSINYNKTDSLGKLVATDESFALGLPEVTDEQKKKNEADTVLNVTTDCKPENVEQNGIIFTFPDPLIEVIKDSISYVAINPKNQESPLEFTLDRDSLDFRKYVLRTQTPYQQGYKYQLLVKPRTFKDIYNRRSKEIKQEFTLPNTEKLGSITLNVSGVTSRYIIDLVSKDLKKVFRSYTVTSDGPIIFPYLAAGEYSFRITEDKNSNGIFDTGDFLKKRQPEKVIFFKLSDGTTVIKLEEQTDMEQDLRL